MVLRALCAAAAIACTFAGRPAEAFCVFNKLDGYRGDSGIVGEVIRGANWSAEIDKGDDACCDWQDRRCNPTGRRDAGLTFGVRSLHAGADAPQSCVVEGEAGGWINVTVEQARGHRGPVARLKCVAFKYRR